jgi:hypothetical protein
MVYPTLPGSQVWDRARPSGAGQSVDPSTLIPTTTGSATVSGEEDWLGPLAAGLATEERAIFDALIASTPTGAFKSSDTPLLNAFVHAIALERRTVERIRHDLVNVSTATLKVYAEAVKSMCELAGVLLLCPQGRVPKDPRGRPRKPRPAAEPGESA